MVNPGTGSHRYECARCGDTRFETGEARMAGGFWSKIFDVQGHRYTRVSCVRCGYTDFYKTDASTLGNIFDFLTRK